MSLFAGQKTKCVFTHVCVCSLLRGAFKKEIRLGFCHNRLDPRPPPWTLGFRKRKKKNSCLLCILGYSKHIIFSWKKITFFGWLVFFLVWTWDPHHIATKSLFCMVVVFGFKKLGLGQTPAPLVGTISQLLLIFFKGFPKHYSRFKL